MDSVNPALQVTNDLFAPDQVRVIGALKELAQIKYNTLIQKNGSDQEWDEVVELRGLATELELNLIQASK